MTTEELNNVADDKSQSVSVLERKIIRQVEYYFGDVNYPKDKFLQEKILEDDGWITLECLTTFNRLKQLSTDFEEIKKALKKSTSGLLEISEEEFKLRRSKDRAVPDADDPLEKKAKQMRTLYMKGFPLTYSFDEVQDFLAEQQTSSVYIKLRKDANGKFKGSIFVELSNQEEADKLLNNKELKCQDTILKVLSREDYFNEKAQERKQNKNGNKMGGTEEEVKYELGMVLHFKNAKNDTLREKYKEYFVAYEPVAWIDFDKGDTQGFIRFSQEGGAQRAIDAAKSANDGKIIIEEAELEVRVLEGEEEKNFWKMAAEDDRKRKNSRTQHRNQKGRFQKDKHRGYGNRKRPWENKKDKTDSSTPQNEHKKFDSDEEEGVNEKEKNETKDETDPKKQKVEAEE